MTYWGLLSKNRPSNWSVIDLLLLLAPLLLFIIELRDFDLEIGGPLINGIGSIFRKLII